MVADFIERQALSWVRLQEFGDKVLSNSRESTGPLDAEVLDIVEELFLVFTDERRVTSQKFE